MAGAVHWRSSLVLVVAAMLVLAGCTEKARTLQVAAAQFEAVSLTAIDTIDAMRRAELAPPPRTAAAGSDEFARNVLGLNGEVTAQNIQILIDPYEVDLPETEPEWQAFLADLRQQYAAFAAVFDSLDQASFTARKLVAKAGPHAEKLTAQMVAFAKVVDENPPRFLQRRSALIAEINAIKQAETLSAPDKAQQLREALDRWLGLEQEEEEMRRRVVEQCTKAATIGYEVRQKIQAYDDLSVADIAEAMAVALATSESLTGQDLSRLRNRVDTIVNAINTDPAWGAVADAALARINEARPRSETPSEATDLGETTEAGEV